MTVCYPIFAYPMTEFKNIRSYNKHKNGIRFRVNSKFSQNITFKFFYHQGCPVLNQNLTQLVVHIRPSLDKTLADNFRGMDNKKLYQRQPEQKISKKAKVVSIHDCKLNHSDV